MIDERRRTFWLATDRRRKMSKASKSQDQRTAMIANKKPTTNKTLEIA
jgi:hypothetical protein